MNTTPQDFFKSFQHMFVLCHGSCSWSQCVGKDHIHPRTSLLLASLPQQVTITIGAACLPVSRLLCTVSPTGSRRAVQVMPVQGCTFSWALQCVAGAAVPT